LFYRRKKIASSLLRLGLPLRSAIACTLLSCHFWLNVVCEFFLHGTLLSVPIWTWYCSIFLGSNCLCNSLTNHVLAVGPDEVVETSVFDLLQLNATHDFIPDIIVLPVDHRWPVLIVVEFVVSRLLVLLLFKFNGSLKIDPLLFSQVIRVIDLPQCTLVIEQCPVSSLVFAPTSFLLGFDLSCCFYRFKAVWIRFKPLQRWRCDCIHRHSSVLKLLCFEFFHFKRQDWHHMLFKTFVFINSIQLVRLKLTRDWAFRNFLKTLLRKVVLIDQWVLFVLCFFAFNRICLVPYSSNRIHKVRRVEHVEIELCTFNIFFASKDLMTRCVLVLW